LPSFNPRSSSPPGAGTPTSFLSMSKWRLHVHCMRGDIASSTDVFIVNRDRNSGPAQKATGGLPPAIKNEPPYDLFIKERR
jgi:hypothetical protein